MQPSVLSIMFPAFVECLVLVGIHSYLGLHVIKRKVIFVDLALAQIAALGATVGFLFGMDPTSRATFWFSMVFTFLGAAVFALTRLRSDRIPQEAVIGLVYAIAAAVSILVVDKSPHGAEHIKDLLTGTILWVKWSQIGEAAAAYSLVGIFHYSMRKKFIRISDDPEGAFRSGMRVRLWDFLFYLSFGFVITFSVRTAGVLLVFVFLVAPAITAALITTRWLHQLLLGWAMGTVVSIVALYISYVMDVPSGPTVVAFYGLVLLLISVVLYVLRADDRRRASLRLAGGTATAVVVLAGLWGLGSALGGSALARDESHDEGVSSTVAATKVDAEPTPDDDPEQRIATLRKHVSAGTPGWRAELVRAVLDPELPLLFRQDAIDLLREKAGTDFGYDPEADGGGAAAAAKMRAWARSGAVETAG